MAQDNDTDAHNAHFEIFPAPGQPNVTQYVTVDNDGDVILQQQPPPDIKSLTLTVKSVDDGSPRLFGTTTVAIFITDYRRK